MTTTTKLSAARILAATLDLDLEGFEAAYRCKNSRDNRAIYFIDDTYFAVGKTPPAIPNTGDTGEWFEWKNKNAARAHDTKVWFCPTVEAMSRVDSFHRGWSAQCRALREKLGLSQSEAAARIEELSVRTWQGWELGKSAPAPWAQRLIMKEFAK